MVVDLQPKNALMASLILCLFLLVCFLLRHELNRFVLTEYGLIESLSTLAYLIGIYYSCKLLSQSKGWLRGNILLWTLLAIFFFGEETSYLQHYIQYQTPEFFLLNNAQQELNFHNITTTGGSIIDAVGSGNLSVSILLKSQNLFNLGFFIYFLLLPVAAHLCPRVRMLVQRFSIPTIGINTLFLFWVPIMLSIALGFSDISMETYLRKYVGETREMFYAFTIATFLYLSWREFGQSDEIIRNSRDGLGSKN